jgi:hypothetical protein
MQRNDMHSALLSLFRILKEKRKRVDFVGLFCNYCSGDDRTLDYPYYLLKVLYSQLFEFVLFLVFGFV